MIAPREAKKNIISLPTNIVTLFWPPLSSHYSTNRETGHWLSEYAHCQGFLQAVPHTFSHPCPFNVLKTPDTSLSSSNPYSPG